MAETSEMVERVRNAIDKAWTDWALGEGRQENYGDVPMELLALAAMRAMIEPTERMLLAAGKTPLGVTPRGGVDYLGKMLPKYWRAMARAALPSPPDPA